MSLTNILLAITVARNLRNAPPVLKLQRGVRKVEVRERIRDLKDQLSRAGLL